MNTSTQRSSSSLNIVARLFFWLLTLLLIAANLLYIFQDGMGDDFWGGAHAPRIVTSSAGETGLAAYDVQAGRLNCPRFIGAGQTKTANLRLFTKSSRDQLAAIVAFISDPGRLDGAQMLNEELPIPAQGESMASWDIGPANLRTDGTIRLRVYSGNKYLAVMSDVRGCTVRYIQIGPLGGEAAGYGLFFLVLLLFWSSFIYSNKGLRPASHSRKTAGTMRGILVTLTLMSLINFFGGGIVARILVLLGILALAALAVQPLMSRD